VRWQLIAPRVLKFGAYDEKTGVCGSCQDLTNSQCFNHSIETQGGVLADECKQLLLYCHIKI
jgi:tRNA(adenine34) deaminase